MEMDRQSLHWLRTNLLWTNTALLVIGTLVILDYWLSKEVQILRGFFAYVAGPFYVGCGVIETYFAWKAAKGFGRGEGLRLPWLLLTGAGACHVMIHLLANVFNQESFVNPLYLFLGEVPSSLANELRFVGLTYIGDLRFVLVGVAFWLVLRAEKRVGLQWALTTKEVGILFLAGLWLGIHAATAILWAQQGHEPLTVDKFFSWTRDFLLVGTLIMAVFIRSSLKPLEPGMIARAWRCYVWGVFLTCMGNAGIWATNYSVLPAPYTDLFWLIWFPQMTMFAIGPLWQYQAMRAVSGEWVPELDQPLAKAAKAG